MAVNTILGNTVITKWQLALQFDPPLIKSEILREIFGLAYEPTTRTAAPASPATSDPLLMVDTDHSALHNFACEGNVPAALHVHHSS